MATQPRATSTNQLFGSVFGGVYVLVGLAGFAITGGLALLAKQGKDLIVFEVNPLHNVVHIAIGAALLLAASKGLAASRTMNTLVGAAYLATAALGVFLATSGQDLNILAINHPDNLLHLATGVLALVIGRGADRGTRDREGGPAKARVRA